MKDFDLSAFLADLRTLCAIDSGHFNAPGTAAVADFFESRYRALGLKTERRYYDNNDFAPFLTARNSEDEQIDVLFVAHMDTVFPVGTGAQWPLEVDADGLAHGLHRLQGRLPEPVLSAAADAAGGRLPVPLLRGHEQRRGARLGLFPPVF